MENMVADALDVAIQAGLPALVWGAPGAGKTAHIQQRAEQLGYLMETVIASIHDPTDFSGLPILSSDGKRGVRLEPPAWAVRLSEAAKGLLFLDEITTAAPAVQAALLRVVLERQVGDLTLGPNVHVVAAANPVEQAAGGYELSMPLANRFVHLDWVTSAEAWVDGVQHGWNSKAVTLPADWKERDEYRETLALVTAYIRQFPHYLHSVPKEGDAAAMRAWPSPRSWMMAAAGLAAARVAGVTEAGWFLVGGSVGEGVAISFRQWFDNLDLPSVESVLKNPDKVKMPKAEDALYALLFNVLSYVERETPVKQEDYFATLALFERVARDGRADLGAFGVNRLFYGPLGELVKTGALPFPKKETMKALGKLFE